MTLHIAITPEQATALLDEVLADFPPAAQARIRGNSTRSRELIKVAIERRMPA